MSNPLRYAFDESAEAATQFAGTYDPDKPPVADDEEPGLEGKDFYSPTQATFANGMHAAIVETDPVTAEITILRYCVVHDCGVMINPMIVEGQVHGGVAQGVGGALYERMAYDESRAAAQRLVHGLPHALRLRGPAHRDRPPRDALPAQPARHQGCRRGRHASRCPPSSPPPSRTPRASRSARCRSAQTSCGTCAVSAPWPPPPPHRRGVRMKISGTATFAAPLDQVWAAVHDPAVLARCLPGCESLRELGPDRYAMTRHRRRRRHQGHLRRRGRALRQVTAPTAFVDEGRGRRRAGHDRADVDVQLAPSAGGGTDLTYDADASVGGAIGGVGQRMLAGVDPQDGRASSSRPSTPTSPASALPWASRSPAGAAVGTAAGWGDRGGGRPACRLVRWSGHRSPATADRLRLGALVGAGIALAGVLVGWLDRRSSLMRALTAAAVQVAPVPGPLTAESCGQPRQVRRLHPPLRRGDRRRAGRAARVGDHRLHPGLPDRGAVGPGLRAARRR